MESESSEEDSENLVETGNEQEVVSEGAESEAQSNENGISENQALSNNALIGDREPPASPEESQASSISPGMKDVSILPLNRVEATSQNDTQFGKKRVRKRKRHWRKQFASKRCSGRFQNESMRSVCSASSQRIPREILNPPNSAPCQDLCSCPCPPVFQARSLGGIVVLEEAIHRLDIDINFLRHKEATSCMLPFPFNLDCKGDGDNKADEPKDNDCCNNKGSNNNNTYCVPQCTTVACISPCCVPCCQPCCSPCCQPCCPPPPPPPQTICITQPIYIPYTPPQPPFPYGYPPVPPWPYPPPYYPPYPYGYPPYPPPYPYPPYPYCYPPYPCLPNSNGGAFGVAQITDVTGENYGDEICDEENGQENVGDEGNQQARGSFQDDGGNNDDGNNKGGSRNGGSNRGGSSRENYNDETRDRTVERGGGGGGNISVNSNIIIHGKQQR